MAEKTQANADKLKVLNAVMEKIEKDFGKGSIMRMNSEEIADIPVIPTGSVTLDMALGVGGYPKGRVIEIYGPESSGKTTLAIHAIAEAQKTGGIAAFIDAEHAFDSFYAQKLGVDVDNLLISQPDNGEQALEIADSLIRSSAIDIIVIDSVAALTPKAEIEGEMGDSKMGLQARLMSQALRKLTSSISKTKTVCIFINQLRDKIGVVYGNPETTTGRQCTEILCECTYRHPSCIGHQRWRRTTRNTHPRESGEKQGRSPVQTRGIRHYVWRRHLENRGNHRLGRGLRHYQESRFMVFLRRQENRPRPRCRKKNC